MEKLVSIKKQLPLQERSYVDRNGQPQTFASKGFVLTDGLDTFYGEMIGDNARAHRDVVFDETVCHAVQTQMDVREYTDKDGVVRYSNEVRITKLV